MEEAGYQKWTRVCESLSTKDINFYFNEREIWWCIWGLNIGHEENGKNELFERPVLILKKINKDLFIGAPLTTKYRGESYKFSIGKIKGEYNYVLIDHFRSLSIKRLEEKIATLNNKTFDQIQKIIFSK